MSKINRVFSEIWGFIYLSPREEYDKYDDDEYINASENVVDEWEFKLLLDVDLGDLIKKEGQGKKHQDLNEHKKREMLEIWAKDSCEYSCAIRVETSCLIKSIFHIQMIVILPYKSQEIRFAMQRIFLLFW